MSFKTVPKYIMLLIFINSIISCEFNKKTSLETEGKRVLGEKLVLSDSIEVFKPFSNYKKDSLSISKSKFKIYSHINASCGSCIDQVESWNNLSIDFNEYQVPIVLICTTYDNFNLFRYMCDSGKIKGFIYPFFLEKRAVYELNEFNEESSHFQTVLTDENNTILAIGNPVLSKEVYNKYMELITKK